MAFASISHTELVIREWRKFTHNILHKTSSTAVDGQSLSLGIIAAVARDPQCRIHIDEDGHSRLGASTDALMKSIERGDIVYGVNTGFGGCAGTRTTEINAHQETLIRELHCGVLVSPENVGPYNRRRQNRASKYDSVAEALMSQALPNEDPAIASSMPEAWVRATILVRINSLIRGYSSVRPVLVQGLVHLLQNNITPRLPLHGSISASGDLSPLSYIGGALQGKPTITVCATDKISGRRIVTTARKALIEANLSSVRPGPKEGLAIVNGTAVSCGVAALALHDANALAVLSQILTAMSVEALCGTSESFDPFFAQLRPHIGQVESSRNIYHFLQGSAFAKANDGSQDGSLRQDRYSIRTASQWISGSLDDLVLANHQIETESNSVTDNPLMDSEGRSLHGGNFQARAITSAMEKTRLALQTFGRMAFTQCTEMINPATSRGLPPNLVADDPSRSWIFKSVDIMVAALLSELGFLANPVGTHVQTAEMGNQALNSLALISARYTHTANDVLSKLVAAHLLAACQALDLRAMQLEFLVAVEPGFHSQLADSFPSTASTPQTTTLSTTLWTHLQRLLTQTTTLDAATRFPSIAQSLQPFLLAALATSDPETLPKLHHWTAECSALLLDTWCATRDAYLAHGTAVPYLGTASRRMYTYVREVLSVPFLHTKVLRTPPAEDDLNGNWEGAVAEAGGCMEGEMEQGPITVGSCITVIYSALRSGALYVPAMECIEEAAVSSLDERNRTKGELGVVERASRGMGSASDALAGDVVDDPLKEKAVATVSPGLML